MKKYQFWIGLLLGTAATALILTIAFLEYQKRSIPVPGSDTGTVSSDSRVRAKLETLENLIDETYLNQVDPQKVADGLYKGLVSGLGDPYSRYYTKEEYDEERTVSSGNYTGIGIALAKMEDKRLVVTTVYEGGPGEEAGIMPEDILTAVDGRETDDWDLTEIVSYIKTGDHESVVLTIERPGEEPQDVTVAVRQVEIPSVTREILEDGTGYLKINEFMTVTPEQFRTMYHELISGGIPRLVVDLRGNPGGYLDSVCNVLREILPEGLIVYTEDRNGSQEKEFCAGVSPIQIPLAVLVDRNSASASEIFAGAVQDYGIGTIVGERTYGKGVVQSIRTFSDGSALKLTVSHYYTPKGHDIHEVGIQPDIEADCTVSYVSLQDELADENSPLSLALKSFSRKSVREEAA